MTLSVKLGSKRGILIIFSSFNFLFFDGYVYGREVWGISEGGCREETSRVELRWCLVVI